MENVPLKVEKRDTIGSGKLNKIRHSGYIPGVIYGKGMEAIPFQVKESVFLENIRHHGKNTIFNLQIGNENAQTVIIQDLQIDHLKNQYLHIDLQRISMDQKREAHVPLHIVGKPKSELKGSVYIQQIEHISVEGFPGDIPENIEVNVSDMVLGDTFTVGQLVIPEKLTVTNNPQEVIVSLSPTRAVAEDLNPKDDTAADEVPIIGNDERETNAT